MNEKFNKNAKVEKFTTMLGIAVRLTVIDPFTHILHSLFIFWNIEFTISDFSYIGQIECPILNSSLRTAALSM